MAQERLIISNTTPIINLAEIARLDLLEKLLGKVTVPQAVVDELQAKRTLFPRAAHAVTSLNVICPQDRLLVRGFQSVVHAGEAECLALAMENPGSLLILNDLQARAMASASVTTSVSCGDVRGGVCRPGHLPPGVISQACLFRLFAKS